MNGVLNIFKPTGMTSHDVVSFIRKTLNIKKVGHAGTLDPNASGVLPMCLGKHTKMSDFLINGDKEYICELILGAYTDTQDMYGNILDKKAIPILNKKDIENIIKSFIGEQYQKPPMYSALKYKGRKLYEYARNNITVDKPSRLINIKYIDILNVYKNKILLKIGCSKGTYIRTICNDIGEKLNTFGHMGILIRTKSKNLIIQNSLSLEKLFYINKLNRINEYIINIDQLIKLEKVIVNNDKYLKLINGNIVTVDNQNISGELIYIYCKNELIGLGKKIEENKVKINKMLI